MLENRLSRKILVDIVSRRLHQKLVVKNEDGRPKGVQELKHAYMMALFHGFHRAMTSGHISRNVLDTLLGSVLENLIVNERREGPSTEHDPLVLVVSPTGTCNLKCEGCYAASDLTKHVSLSWEIFDRIVTEKRELWDSYLTIVSGGEPFLWRDGERSILDLAEKHPTEYFMTYTNGTLIDEDAAKRMGELGNVTPALSLEGYEKETDARRGAGVYRKILDTFERLRRHGVPFGVSITPTNRNWDLLTSDDFLDFCVEEQGAVYIWCFQYMPIGRDPDLGLMIAPENRLEMLKRTRRMVFEKKILFADFWNSGIASYGCISAGRPGGQFYIDWNGDVTPCVFVPYAADNIYDVYARGDDLSSLLKTPFFRKIHDWQYEYGFGRPAEEVGNWLCPCPIRDHFDDLRTAAVSTGARPINEAAAEALEDPGYHRVMTEYAEEYRKLSDPVWQDEFEEK